MAVLSIALGLATLSMVTLRGTSLSTETRKFADFLNLCRSQAIARHTAIRVGVVVESPNPEEVFRRYSAWTWNRKTRHFEQSHQWHILPGDLVFEPTLPDYVKESPHAERDVSSVRGDYLLGPVGETFTVGEGQLARFVEFSPSGRASIPGGTLRNLILVLRPGEAGGVYAGTNWSQFNVDTFTGRVRIYRP